MGPTGSVSSVIPIRNVYGGACSVCGLTKGHDWVCISYFMTQAIQGYKESLSQAKKVLIRLRDGEALPVNEVNIIIRMLSFPEDVIKAVGEEEKRSELQRV